MYLFKFQKREASSNGLSESVIEKLSEEKSKGEEEIEELNKRFGKWEQVKKIELTPDIWSIDAGHLTPTMKLKRKIIKEKYQYLYDKIYNNA